MLSRNWNKLVFDSASAWETAFQIPWHFTQDLQTTEWLIRLLTTQAKDCSQTLLSKEVRDQPQFLGTQWKITCRSQKRKKIRPLLFMDWILAERKGHFSFESCCLFWALAQSLASHSLLADLKLVLICIFVITGGGSCQESLTARVQL